MKDDLEYPVHISEDLVRNYLQHLFFDQPYINYPYPLHNAIREYKDGIHLVKGFEGHDILIVTRFDDVNDFITNPLVERPRRLSKDERMKLSDSDPQQMIKQNAMFFLSGTDHKRLRGLVNSAFQPKLVNSLEARIRKILEDILFKVAYAEKFDFVNSIGFPLPILVIMDLLGVPTGDIGKVRQWSARMVIAFARVPVSEDEMEDVNEAILECWNYFSNLFNIKRSKPSVDLISELVSIKKLSDEEIFGTVMITLIAGHETTTNAISTMILHIIRNSELRAKLGHDPSMWEPFIEEMLRFEPPFAFMTRVAHGGFSYRGHTIKKGDEIYLHYAAANRDPRQFVDPDQIIIGREKKTHLSFGKGAHYCLGAPLARLELKLCLEYLLPFLEDYEIIPNTLKIKRTGEVRGIEKMVFKRKDYSVP